MKSMKKTDGFTLVELIVVIAILAILAAVAIPAYSGYVEKAQRAGDEQLLATINRAFASACLENGTDMALQANPRPAIMLKAVEGGLAVDLATVSPYKDAFARFYEGNEASVFKVYQGITFSNEMGCFVEGYTYVDANGNVYSAFASDVAAVKNTTWLGKANLGSSAILDMMDNTVTASQNFTAYATTVSSPEFKAAAAKALGMTEAEYATYRQGLVDAKIEELVASGVGRGEARNKAPNLVDGNMAVLVASTNSQNVDIMTTLKGSNAKDSIESALANDPVGGLSQAALAYGLYNAYIYSRDDLTAEQIQEYTMPGYAVNHLNDTGFQEYLNKQGATDLEGLKAAMNVIGSQDQNTIQSAVTNGFDANNEDLAGALLDILGQ